MNFKYLLDLCKSMVSLKNPDKQVDNEIRRDLLKVGSAFLGGSALLAAQPFVAKASEIAVGSTQMFVLDLVGDGNSFVSCRVPKIADVEKGQRGDSFLVQSGLYKGDTINAGTLPGFPGAIGKWFCWGVYNIKGANALRPGPIPPFLSTEIFLFDDGSQMVTFGGEFIIPSFSRILAGGAGKYANARGIMEFQAIGVNPTLGTNGRYIIRFVQ
jgi:hypothetical protein